MLRTDPSVFKSLIDFLHLEIDMSVGSLLQGSGKFYITTNVLVNTNKQLGLVGGGVVRKGLVLGILYLAFYISYFESLTISMK